MLLGSDKINLFEKIRKMRIVKKSTIFAFFNLLWQTIIWKVSETHTCYKIQQQLNYAFSGKWQNPHFCKFWAGSLRSGTGSGAIVGQLAYETSWPVDAIPCLLCRQTHALSHWMRGGDDICVTHARGFDLHARLKTFAQGLRLCMECRTTI